MDPEVKTGARMTPSGARLILAATAMSCAAVVVAMPLPVEPSEMPALLVSSELETRSIEALRASARAAPTGPEVARFERDLAEANRAEVGEGETEAARSTRRSELLIAFHAVQARHGARGVAALRAKAALRAEDAFRGRLDRAATDSVLGGFGSVLAFYGGADERSRRVTAPMFVVRTLYAARFNTQVGLAPLEGLGVDERRVYWGWLALEAESAPEALRADALTQYGRLGGEGYPEARAVLLYRAGLFAEASRAFRALYSSTGELRYRNHALAAAMMLQ